MEDIEYVISDYLKVISRVRIDVRIQDEVKYDYIDQGTVKMSSRGIPEDAYLLSTISYREENPALVGRIAHIASHLAFPPKQEEVEWLEEDKEAFSKLLAKKPLLTNAVKKHLLERINASELSTPLREQLVDMGLDIDLLYQEQVDDAKRVLADRESGEVETMICMIGELPEDEPGEIEPDDTQEESESVNDSDNEFLDEEEWDEDNSDEEIEPADDDFEDNDDSPGDAKDDFEEDTDDVIDDDDDVDEITDEQAQEEQRQFYLDKHHEIQEHNRMIKRINKQAKDTFPTTRLTNREREANYEDRLLANQLAKELKKAKWRKPEETEVSSMFPPGRLVSREAVTWTAQRSMGIPITAEPFQQVFVEEQESPPPVVGMMCDTSGSMTASEKPLAQLFWAMSKSVPQVGGEFAAVSFGNNEVKTLAKPKERLQKVPLIKARGGKEIPFEASQALTGALGFLTNQEAVKVLLISSDCEWSAKQTQKTYEMLRILEQYGVHILWTTFMGKSWIEHKARLSRAPLIFNQIGAVLEFENNTEVAKGLGKAITEIVGDA